MNPYVPVAAGLIGLYSTLANAQDSLATTSGGDRVASSEAEPSLPDGALANPSVVPTPAPTASDQYGGPTTLFKPATDIGGYGGMSVLYSQVDGDDGALVGVEGGLLVDHRLTLGGAGYGWTRDERGPADTDGIPRNLRLGYGGLLLRYSVLTGTPVYGSVGALVGGGALALDRDTHGDDHENHDNAVDAFFVFEPQLSVQVNLVRWMRLGVQGGYRITSGLGHLGYTEGDINALTLGGTVQFGVL